MKNNPVDSKGYQNELALRFSDKEIIDVTLAEEGE